MEFDQVRAEKNVAFVARRLALMELNKRAKSVAPGSGSSSDEGWTMPVSEK